MTDIKLYTNGSGVGKVIVTTFDSIELSKFSSVTIFYGQDMIVPVS